MTGGEIADFFSFSDTTQKIKIANLRQKKTHSGQTDKSHFRREVETQVYLPKDSDTQTKVGASQGMARRVRHLTGLRGDPKTKQPGVVEVSFDLAKTTTEDKAV